MKKFLISTIITLCVTASFGQSKIKQEKTTFDWSPFDISTTSIPVGYKGHDCRSIASILKKQKTEKDEFETTEEYRSRISEISLIPLGKSLSAGDKIAFRVEIDTDYGIKFLADERILFIMSRPEPTTMYVNGKSANWDSVVRFGEKERRYQASNAFGATVTVTRRDIKTCAVAFTNWGYAPHNTIDVVLRDVGSDVARRAKAGVSFLYIGTLQAPFVKEVYESTAPKMDWPLETHWTGDALVMKLEQAWAVEKKTGEVLGKREFLD